MTKKITKVLIIIMMLFIVFSFYSFKTNNNATAKIMAKDTDIVDFKIRRKNDTFVFDSVKVNYNLPIKSITIKIPEGMKLDSLSIPAGWKTYNANDANIINFLIEASATSGAVATELKNLVFDIEDIKKTKGEIEISVIDRLISSWEDENGVTHYYELISSSLSWLQAYNEAETKTYKGLTGYLANVTSLEEHDFIYNSISKLSGWLGGTRLLTKTGERIIPTNKPKVISTNIADYDIATGDQWYWTSGPEAGVVNLQTRTWVNEATSVPTGVYNGWTPGEPNNSYGNEHVMQFAHSGKGWNDLPTVSQWVAPVYGYYVEYSEYDGQQEEVGSKADVPQPVTVRYVDELGVEVAPSLLVGDNYLLEDPYDAKNFKLTIPNCKYLSSTGVEVGKYTNQPIEIVHRYKKNPKIVIDFDLIRSKEEILLNNVDIYDDYGDIKSLTINMPEGLVLKPGTLPVGWETKNIATDSTINFLMTANTTVTDVENFLTKIKFEVIDENKSKGNIIITISERIVSSWEDPTGKRYYYEFIPRILNWYEAYNDAKNHNYKGLTGYLASISSLEEHDYIFKSIAKKPGWLGGTRSVMADGSKINDRPVISEKIPDFLADGSKNKWYWAAGPQATQEFYHGTHYSTGKKVAGVYSAFNGNQPDNYGGEPVLQFALKGSDRWNDLHANVKDSSSNSGYYVKYSEYGGQVENEEDSNSKPIPQVITIHYLEEGTNAILAPVSFMPNTNYIKMGDSFNSSTVEKDISNYEITKIDGIKTGVFDDEAKIITYYYKLKLQDIVIKFKDEDGITLHADEVIEDKLIGSKYNLTTNQKVQDIVNNIVDTWYEVQRPQKETEIEVKQTGTEVNYVFKGLIGFKSVTSKMTFEKGYIYPFSQTLEYKSSEDFMINILDNRGITAPATNYQRGQFSVNATLTVPFTNKEATVNKILTAAELIYNDGTDDHVINNSGTSVYGSTTKSNDRNFIIKLDENGDISSKGLSLRIPTGTGLELGKYNAEITWDLVQGP